MRSPGRGRPVTILTGIGIDDRLDTLEHRIGIGHDRIKFGEQAVLTLSSSTTASMTNCLSKRTSIESEVNVAADAWSRSRAVILPPDAPRSRPQHAGPAVGGSSGPVVDRRRCPPVEPRRCSTHLTRADHADPTDRLGRHGGSSLKAIGYRRDRRVTVTRARMTSAGRGYDSAGAGGNPAHPGVSAGRHVAIGGHSTSTRRRQSDRNRGARLRSATPSGTGPLRSSPGALRSRCWDRRW